MMFADSFVWARTKGLIVVLVFVKRRDWRANEFAARQVRMIATSRGRSAGAAAVV
jgi:hypothetical protein